MTDNIGEGVVMKKTLTVFMIVMMLAFAVVMFFYWHEESRAISKGVLVWKHTRELGDAYMRRNYIYKDRAACRSK